MPLAVARLHELQDDLLSIMDRKNHWAWPHFNEGHATRPQLLLHFQQEFDVYVRDFPVFLSRVHSRCPHPEVRQDLAENMYEEETGKLSKGVPHPELFLVMMEGLGFPRARAGGSRRPRGRAPEQRPGEALRSGPALPRSEAGASHGRDGAPQDGLEDGARSRRLAAGGRPHKTRALERPRPLAPVPRRRGPRLPHREAPASRSLTGDGPSQGRRVSSTSSQPPSSKNPNRRSSLT